MAKDQQRPVTRASRTLGACIALMAAIVVATSIAPAGAAPAPTWAPGCNGEPTGWSQHPSRIGLTCDSLDIIVGVRWRHWGRPTAQATGTLNAAIGCTPSCAQAPRHHYHVTIIASHIGYCGTRRVYGELTVGFSEAGHARKLVQPTFCSFSGQRPTSTPPH
jgi:hypothetical protein